MNDSEYKIVEVDDLGVEYDWMLVDDPRRVILFVRRNAITSQLVADAWAAYRRVVRQREEPRRILGVV